MADKKAVSSRGDDLALARTHLANERTLLAYGRTALMVAATGVTLIKFFADTVPIRTMGLILIGLGLIVGLVGIQRFVSLKRRLN
ncbi:DUF202 domain-containing protein [Rubripirellula reticaptiva]|uniref:DUF202 domain-containing protein n=1 Tax=Rubripirellula reticaptiva TaxID=2528013 RepID=A0A5C6F6S7_9BACT|nr:DUF202 domain-containing protein [Rubripirellula reticaptiva]TWU56174.1 hypothetical protein Poly59_24780 [Rubripirellula reticaptiva]